MVIGVHAGLIREWYPRKFNCTEKFSWHSNAEISKLLIVIIN